MFKFFISSAIVLIIALAALATLRLSMNTDELVPVKEMAVIKEFADWTKYHAVEGGFAILVPAYPQHSKEVIPIDESETFLQYDMYITEEEDGTTYMVNLITYPEDLELNYEENLMENAMSEMLASNPMNRLKSLDLNERNGGKSMNFSLENEEVTINSTTFMHGNKLYILSVIDTLENYEKEEYEHFVASFQQLK